MSNRTTLLGTLALSLTLLFPVAASAQSGGFFSPGDPDPGAVNPRIPVPDREVPDRDRDGSPDAATETSNDADSAEAPAKKRKQKRAPKVLGKPVSLGELDLLIGLAPPTPEWAPAATSITAVSETLQPCALQDPNGRRVRW
ncbi:MAG: hypothetical protein KDA24_24495 [Deltaproteobacteria bacterium]|nr:hypothetical protein [Deltaproteobacteria bacterium]